MTEQVLVTISLVESLIVSFLALIRVAMAVNGQIQIANTLNTPLSSAWAEENRIGEAIQWHQHDLCSTSDCCRQDF